jgi:Tol biopolymer transport system component
VVPDGTQLAFYSNRNGSYQIYTIKPDGSGLRAVTDTTLTCLYPVWSPDGTRLAFEASGQTSIVEVDKTWKDLSPFALPLVESGPSDWSPDGRFIAGNTQNGQSTTVLYDTEAKKYRTLFPSAPPRWLSDGRLMPQTSISKVVLLDVLTGKNPVEIANPINGLLLGGISKDDRSIFGRIIKASSELWTINLRSGS